MYTHIYAHSYIYTYTLNEMQKMFLKIKDAQLTSLAILKYPIKPTLIKYT